MEKTQVIQIMKEIGELSTKRGLTSYAVGGLVRDFLMDIPSDDLDITSNDVDALAEEMLRVGGKIIEKNSERFMGKIIYYKGLKIDLVAPRKESYNPASIKPLVKVGTFKDDVFRRDFNLNALYFDLDPNKFMKIVDLTGQGLSDLNAKILDTPLDPRQTFIDDPSRMLRAVRFAAVKGFTIAQRIYDVIEDVRNEILRVPFEIIHNELLKGAKSPKYFRIMDELGLTDILFPEVVLNRDVYQNPKYHTEDAYEHILRTTEKIRTDNPLLRIASYLHDIGKVIVDIGTGQAHEHIPKGIPIAEQILRRYKFSNKEIKYILEIITHHHTFHNIINIYSDKGFNRCKGLRKFVTKYPPQFVEDIYEHSRADTLSDKPHAKTYLKALKRLMEEVDVIQTNIILDNSKEKLQITGYDIMEYGIQGVEIGQIKDELQNLVDDGILPNHYSTLKTKLHEIIESRST